MIRIFFKKLSEAFSKKERAFFMLFSLLAVISGVFLFINFIANSSVLVPEMGGSYTEGIVGQPSYINPVLARDNTPDKDLSILVFANLFDISESVKHDGDFKSWSVRIKEGATWHDGSKITSDDVVFTVHTIQNPDTLSPLFSDWQNVTIERISELEVKFNLASPYSIFENVLKELRPIQKKSFADISTSAIRLSSFNLNPVGSGPFRFSKINIRKDGFITDIYLKRNGSYSPIGQSPFIENFNIRFFENEKGLVSEYGLGLIDGFGANNISAVSNLKINSEVEEISTSKYYAVFFNPNANSLISSKLARQAMTFSINKEKIVSEIFDGRAIVSNGPVPPSLSMYENEVEKYYEYNIQKASDILNGDGWKKGDDGIWFKTSGKNTVFLEVSVKSPDVFPIKEIAQSVVEQWNDFGIKADLVIVDSHNFNDLAIKTRDYEILVFGNILSSQPDLFSFWHSSEKFYPGLNLSLYENDQIDKSILLLRKIGISDAKRMKIFSDIQETISSDYPAIFIASPYFFYVHKKNISGIEIKSTISLQEDRFLNVANWFVKTERTFK